MLLTPSVLPLVTNPLASACQDSLVAQLIAMVVSQLPVTNVPRMPNVRKMKLVSATVKISLAYLSVKLSDVALELFAYLTTTLLSVSAHQENLRVIQVTLNKAVLRSLAYTMTTAPLIRPVIDWRTAATTFVMKVPVVRMQFVFLKSTLSNVPVQQALSQILILTASVHV